MAYKLLKSEIAAEENMKRNLIIAVYIFVVLAISAIAKAEVYIYSAQFDYQTNLIQVDGYVSEDCIVNYNPTATVSALGNSTQSVRLMLFDEILCHRRQY